jgi:integrase/recombinase XerD
MAMVVQKVMGPGGETSWTVLDERFEPVEAIEAYLAHLEAIERSPNTVRAYASSLRLFFDFLAARGVAWDAVGLEEVGWFVSWLRRPSDEVVIPIDAGVSARTASTVNRHLATVFGLYDFHARRGLGVATELVDWRRGGRGSYKPFSYGTAGQVPRIACVTTDLGRDGPKARRMH